jgi:phosphoribosylanthranilate isomerase
MAIFQKIKICGINDLKIVQAINNFKIGFVGFIAYEKSPRFISKQKYFELASNLDNEISSVLVVVNPDIAMLKDYIEVFSPDFIQLHGSESLNLIQQIKQQFGLPIIKAIPANADISGQIEHYQSHVDMLLFDTSHGGSFGGTGVSFDWDLLKRQYITKPYFLSGGIGSHNIKAALATKADFIDVSSSLESEKGVKDVAKIQFFMNIVQEYESESQLSN